MKNLKKNAGFTLVELIVVIAILGILAGVGTVAYTGYVEKAKEAADQQLLSAVNLAFASACIDSGTDINELTAAEVSTVGEVGHKKVTGASSTQISDGDFSTNFMKYFAGNEKSEFQRFIRLEFDKDTHLFKGVLPDSYILPESLRPALNAYKNSGFNGKEEKLIESVDNVSNDFQSWLGENPELSSVAMYLGGQSSTEYQAFVAMFGDNTNPSAEEISNMMVKYVAAQSTSKNMSASDVLTILKNNDNLSTANGLIGQQYGVLPSYALLYGVITGYANTEGENAASDNFKTEYAKGVKSLTDITTLYGKMMNDSNFNQYCGNYADDSQFAKDMAGYIGALQILDANSDKIDVNKGFTDPELKDLISSILAS